MTLPIALFFFLNIVKSAKGVHMLQDGLQLIEIVSFVFEQGITAATI